MNFHGGAPGGLERCGEPANMATFQLQQQHFRNHQYHNYSQDYGDQLQHHPQQIAMAGVAGTTTGTHFESQAKQINGITNQPQAISVTSRRSASAAASGSGGGTSLPSRYESQKRRDWNTFGQYLRNHRPPLALAKCSGAHVLEFLKYLDQFGKTKVHATRCPFFGHPHPPAPCTCPLRQAWGSLDALIGRLRAAFEEHGGRPESNPFGTRAVRLYLREIREMQAKARGIAYEKKKRRKPIATSSAGLTTSATMTAAVPSSSSSSPSAMQSSNACVPIYPHLHNVVLHSVNSFAGSLHPEPLLPPSHDVIYATTTNMPCSSDNAVPHLIGSNSQYLHPIIDQCPESSIFQ